MKSLDDMLMLGDPRLYEVSSPVLRAELPLVKEWVNDLDQVMQAIRAKYHFGRAIAAPQLGIMKRLIYINVDRPVVMINPEIIDKSDELFEVWDDCMCFPLLFVKVKRHRNITVNYLDVQWESHQWNMTDDFSELFQHEYDHLEGILCTMRAIDEKSFKWRT